MVAGSDCDTPIGVLARRVGDSAATTVSTDGSDADRLGGAGCKTKDKCKNKKQLNMVTKTSLINDKTSSKNNKQQQE